MSNTMMLSLSSRTRRLFCFFTVTLALGTLGMFAPRSADALSFGTVTFMGIDFDLNIDETSFGIYDINLEVDTTGWTGDSTDLLHAVSVKPTSGPLDISKVVSDPPPAGTWELLAGQSNANTIIFDKNKKCCTNNMVGGNKKNGLVSESGWYTEAFTTEGGLVLDGTTYTFDWTIDYGETDLFSAGDEIGLKAIFVKANDPGQFSTQMSETAVPIPGTFLLFGASFAGFVAWRVRDERRRNRQVAA